MFHGLLKLKEEPNHRIADILRSFSSTSVLQHGQPEQAAQHCAQHGFRHFRRIPPPLRTTSLHFWLTLYFCILLQSTHCTHHLYATLNKTSILLYLALFFRIHFIFCSSFLLSLKLFSICCSQVFSLLSSLYFCLSSCLKKLNYLILWTVTYSVLLGEKKN